MKRNWADVLKSFQEVGKSGGVPNVPVGISPEQRRQLLDIAKESGWECTVTKSAATLLPKAAKPGEDVDLELVITTGDIDRDYEVLDPSGCVYEQFLKNPVVLWAHDMVQLPVGKGVYLRAVADGWALGVKFVPADVDDFAGKVAWYYANGYLHDTSIRFRPLEAEPKDFKVDGYYTRFTKWELLEASAVTIGANPFAGTGKSVKAIADEWCAEMDKKIESVSGDGLKIGAELSRKNRERLQNYAVSLRSVLDDIEDLLSRWDEDVYGDEPEGEEDEPTRCEAPAEDDKPKAEGEGEEEDVSEDAPDASTDEDESEEEPPPDEDDEKSVGDDALFTLFGEGVGVESLAGVNAVGADTPAHVGEERKTGAAVGVTLDVLEQIVRDELKYRLGICD